jgi:hypothetical protein
MCRETTPRRRHIMPRRGRARAHASSSITPDACERGMEVTVKGPRDAVWCGVITRVRARASKNQLTVRWFDTERATRAGTYAVWDCARVDAVDVKSVWATHRAGTFARPTGARAKACSACARAKTTCAKRFDVVGDDAEL